MPDLYNKSDWNPLTWIDDEALSVGATSTTLTGASRAKMAIIQVQVAPVRSRIGSGATVALGWSSAGTDPTATVGKLWNVGDEFAVRGNELNVIEFIATGATATLFVEYYA